MSEQRYAMVDSNGYVYNVVMWDSDIPWENDADQLIQTDEAGIGWTLVDGVLEPPAPDPRATSGPDYDRQQRK